MPGAKYAGQRSREKSNGQAARSIAEQHSWASMAQSYVDLLEELSKYDDNCSHTLRIAARKTWHAA